MAVDRGCEATRAGWEQWRSHGPFRRVATRAARRGQPGAGAVCSVHKFVERPEDVDGFAAQLAVDRAEVALGELARAEVHLGVADLAVLGLLGRLELLAARLVARLFGV